MNKKVNIWGMVFILILNMVLMAVPYNSVGAMEKNQQIIKVPEGIESILTNENKILLINKVGQAILKKGNDEIKIEGNTFKVLSNSLIINDENEIYDIVSERFLESEEAKECLVEINSLKEQYDYEDIYLLNDKIVLKINNTDSYTLVYLNNVDNNYVEENEVQNINADDIYIDNNNIVYISKNNELIKYENEKEEVVYNSGNTYKYSIYDKNNIVVYNENEYIEIGNNDSESKEDISITESKIEELESSDLATESNVNSTYIDLQSNGESITYQSHVQNIGWQGWKNDGALSGTEGKSYRLEAIRIKLNNLPEGATVSYRTHIQDIGWQDWKQDGELSGTEGRSKRLEAIQINLLNLPDEYHVEYRVHVQDIGWQAWKRDGEVAGTEGRSKRLEAIEIRVVKESNDMNISYSSLVKNEGWYATYQNGEYVGSTKDNPIKALKVNLSMLDSNISIKYRAHVQNQGWNNWVKGGEVAGSENTENLLEAFEIQLVNAPSNYHILYRANVKGYGWQGWKQDGAEAGTTGLSGQIIGIEIKIVKDISEPTVKYTTHVQNVGWQDYKKNSELSGTEGRGLRLEGIKIKLDNLDSENAIMYRTHVQNIGWQEWVSNDELSGTEGKAYRLEAIQIKLKEEIPGYKLYYRVHVQDYGWQGWRAEGETAGTVGSSKRLEAIEIKLVKNKNKSIVIDAGHNYGGDDGAYSTHDKITYIERNLNMSMALKLKRTLESNGFEVIMTRNSEDRETIAVKQSLQKRANIANYLNADFFISIHQNSAAQSSANGVEVFYSSAEPLSGGQLLKNGVEYNAIKSRTYVASEKVNKSKAISKSIVDSISKQMNRSNRGISDRDFYVVKNTYMPSVLVECGFISNPLEAKKLADDSLQQKMSEIISTEINKEF